MDSVFERKLNAEFNICKSRQEDNEREKMEIFKKIRHTLLVQSYLMRIIRCLVIVGSTNDRTVSIDHAARDLDLAIFLNRDYDDDDDQLPDAVTLLHRVADELMAYIGQYIVRVYRYGLKQKSRIKVLTIVFCNNCAVDFVVEAMESVRTTTLIRSAILFDYERFVKFFFAVKLFAKHYRLSGSRLGRLSSTCINAICLHFLQTHGYFPPFDNLYQVMMDEDDPLDLIFKSPGHVDRFLKQNLPPSYFPPATLTEMLTEVFLHWSLFDFHRYEMYWLNGQARVRKITTFDAGVRSYLVIRNPVSNRLTSRSVQKKSFLDKINKSAKLAYTELCQTNALSFF